MNDMPNDMTEQGKGGVVTRVEFERIVDKFAWNAGQQMHYPNRENERRYLDSKIEVLDALSAAQGECERLQDAVADLQEEADRYKSWYEQEQKSADYYAKERSEVRTDYNSAMYQVFKIIRGDEFPTQENETDAVRLRMEMHDNLQRQLTDAQARESRMQTQIAEARAIIRQVADSVYSNAFVRDSFEWLQKYPTALAGAGEGKG